MAKRVTFQLSAEERLHDLLIQYESLQVQLNVSDLHNKEYLQEISELNQQNEQLTLDINTYKDILEIEQGKTTVTHEKLSALDDIHLDNLDLNAQIKEYQKLIKQLKIENIQLKNENDKYKLAMENNNELKQKREEIYANNKSILLQKNKELQHEIDVLNANMNAIMHHNNQKVRSRRSSAGSAKYEPHLLMSPTQSMHIHSGKGTPARALTPPLSPYKSAPVSPCRGSDWGLSPIVHAHKLRNSFSYDPGYGDMEDNKTEYSSAFEYEPHESRASIDLKEYHLNLIQGMSKDAEELNAKTEEIQKLKEMKEKQDLVIEGLEKEMKLLKQRNRKLKKKLDDRFVCSSLFS